MPDGGTSPMREPGGKIASAAQAGIAEAKIASAAARQKARIEPWVAMAGHAEASAVRKLELPGATRVTRRMVRLIRPPSGSKRDVPG